MTQRCPGYKPASVGAKHLLGDHKIKRSLAHEKDRRNKTLGVGDLGIDPRHGGRWRIPCRTRDLEGFGNAEDYDVVTLPVGEIDTCSRDTSRRDLGESRDTAPRSNLKS